METGVAGVVAGSDGRGDGGGREEDGEGGGVIGVESGVVSCRGGDGRTFRRLEKEGMRSCCCGGRVATRGEHERCGAVTVAAVDGLWEVSAEELNGAGVAVGGSEV